MFVVVLKVVVDVFVVRDDLELGQGSEEVASVALLIGVADELSVQLLVTGKGDATGLPVLIVEELLVGSIQLSNGLVGHPLDAVCPVLVDSNSAVTVNINSSEKSVNESLEGLGEIIVALAYTMILESLLKLISGHLTILVEVSQISDLVPQVLHDLLVLLELGVIPFAFAFDDCVANGQTFEVVLVQETVVVNVVHVPDDEFDAVVP
jgi:hypothetical protein